MSECYYSLLSVISQLILVTSEELWSDDIVSEREMTE